MESQELLHLIKRFRQGNNDAFNAIYRLYDKLLFHFAQKFTNREDAKEIVSDAFIKLWERKEQFDSLDNIRAFLLTVTRNRCINALNASKTRNRHLKELLLSMPLEDLTYYQFTTNVMEEKLRKRIPLLPSRLHEVANLLLIEWKTVDEVAEQLNKKPKTIRNLMYEAIAALRNMDNGRAATILLLLFFAAFY
jgi:RNA polymerase sigma-70 factor (ECF subfamily)